MGDQILYAREMSLKKDPSALQWAKTLRDLIDLRDRTLLNIKAHLLGRGETGAVNEPDDCWDHNSEIMFERTFQTYMAPWTRKDLELKCKDCGQSSEGVSNRYFSSVTENWKEIKRTENVNLCQTCYDKRLSQEPTNKDSPKGSVEEGTISAKIALTGTMIQDLPPDQRKEWIQKLKEQGVTDAILEKIGVKVDEPNIDS